VLNLILRRRPTDGNRQTLRGADLRETDPDGQEVI